MSVEIVVHKGYQNILYENSMMGILAAIFKGKICEFDIIFVDDGWRICHDFNVLSPRNVLLTEFLMILKQHPHCATKQMIVDIKWDFVKNRNNNIFYAIQILRQNLEGCEDLPFWLQASHFKILDVLMTLAMPSLWRIGLIIYNIDEFNTHSQYIHYAMISLTDFTTGDIVKMHSQYRCLLYGYTCHDSKDFIDYKHLFPFLEGLVCDVSL